MKPSRFSPRRWLRSSFCDLRSIHPTQPTRRAPEGMRALRPEPRLHDPHRFPRKLHLRTGRSLASQQKALVNPGRPSRCCLPIALPRLLAGWSRPRISGWCSNPQAAASPTTSIEPQQSRETRWVVPSILQGRRGLYTKASAWRQSLHSVVLEHVVEVNDQIRQFRFGIAEHGPPFEVGAWWVLSRPLALETGPRRPRKEQRQGTGEG